MSNVYDLQAVRDRKKEKAPTVITVEEAPSFVMDKIDLYLKAIQFLKSGKAADLVGTLEAQLIQHRIALQKQPNRYPKYLEPLMQLDRLLLQFLPQETLKQLHESKD